MKANTTTPSLKISQCVLDRLNGSAEECTGFVYGSFMQNTLMVIGVHLQSNDNNEPALSFPTNIDHCGYFKISDDPTVDKDFSKLTEDVVVTDNPLYLHKYRGKSNQQIDAYYVINDRLEKVEFSIITEKDLYSDIVHLRLKAKVPLVCEMTQEAVTEGFKQLTNELAMGLVSFHISSTDIYLLGSCNEQAAASHANTKIGDICPNSNQEDTGDKKKKQYGIDVFLVDMYKKATIDPYSENIKKHAPIVHVDKRNDLMLMMPLELDCLSIVQRNTKVSMLYDVLIESVCRNLKLLQNLLLKSFEENRGDQPIPISKPEIFHFFPDGLGHFITRVYESKKSDSSLMEDRKRLHQQFLLPLSHPIFRRSNKYAFKGEELIPNKLINPHTEVKPTNNGGEIAIVKGNYAYFHYLQDKMNDDGWGCAYRSLQTLCSWFLLQGLTEKPVPTFKQIQQCLFDIGDKPSKFVGSSQWIGSTEVNFVLNTWLNIDCKILYCSSGQEVAEQGPELVYHFQTHGSPIMIGGGVLAHTILGVDYNEETGNIKFLILDPHYTGSDDLTTIVKKGWCGWKNADFWDKKAYYNLCLPQVVTTI